MSNPEGISMKVADDITSEKHQLLSDEEINALLAATRNFKLGNQSVVPGEVEEFKYYNIKIPIDCSFSSLKSLVQLLINELLPIEENDLIAKHPLYKQWLTPKDK